MIKGIKVRKAKKGNVENVVYKVYKVNVVYKRKGNTYGLIEPEFQ